MDLLVRAVMIVFGVLFSALIVLEMEGNLAGSWTTVGQNVASVAVAIAFLGIVAIAVGNLLRRR